MFIPLLSQQESYRLNQLIGVALAEPDVRNRLLEHDPQLIVDFDLPQRLWRIMTCIHAHSLKNFCEQLLYLEAQM